jgi:hypothetical protein
MAQTRRGASSSANSAMSANAPWDRKLVVREVAGMQPVAFNRFALPAGVVAVEREVTFDLPRGESSPPIQTLFLERTVELLLAHTHCASTDANGRDEAEITAT